MVTNDVSYTQMFAYICKIDKQTEVFNENLFSFKNWMLEISNHVHFEYLKWLL